ncbi:hypothetical protein B566_EDAN001794 [Ephemera danica]|nr:hypothetical protein B566_EDAN001794 [Ephemera danica]
MKMSGHVWCVVVMLTLFVCCCVVHTSSPTEPPGPPGIPASREVKIKQGKLRGFVLKYKRGAVEIFLGIPYASPPVGSQRFMPPGSPPPWPGVRLADSFGPVCPQNPPDISNEKEALKAMSAGRYNYLKRLLPYLRNQSEDCLYLNIYAPSPGLLLKSGDITLQFRLIFCLRREVLYDRHRYGISFPSVMAKRKPHRNINGEMLIWMESRNLDGISCTERNNLTAFHQAEISASLARTSI